MNHEQILRASELYRDIYGISPSQQALEIGVGASLFSRIEKGARLEEESIEKIANYYCMGLAEYDFGVGE